MVSNISRQQYTQDKLEEERESSTVERRVPVVPSKQEAENEINRIARVFGVPVDGDTVMWRQFKLTDLSLKFRIVSTAMSEFGRIDVPQTTLTSLTTLGEVADYFSKPIPLNPLDFDDPVRRMFTDRKNSLPLNLGFWEPVREVEKPLRRVEALKKGGSLGKRRI
ncbi:hypothetical protein M427DRAFT_63013 [Gonapodya prolifera JEL478]|uniref:Uncharacterized protein n=1 Tax=Gonapodya prolifera (strain JEL478) TaxID=1344416 RepID=A0A139A0B7_GONPJ|nr:hypothetical protein M427DRAFT_63013 [Gonapodya prolifera JEL478]|eukprot:KXS10078.1 hypothetical protein M427DRAFT_63013 [Gonapodya prolifera JEL478]